jgi:hypothetical protein
LARPRAADWLGRWAVLRAKIKEEGEFHFFFSEAIFI